MKKSLIALAVLGLSGAAMAQSSVTLYGVADVGGGKIEKGAMAGNDASDGFQMTSGSLMNNGTSRLGVRGVEDLGGGLKAGFNFETGLDLDGGQADDAFWQRAANLWLGGNWGTFKMGRSLSPSFYGVATWELTGAANYSVVATTYGAAGAGTRNDSMFSYKTPNFGGFSAELGFRAKGDDPKNITGRGGRKYDLNVIYANGPLGIGFSANKVQDNETNMALGAKYNFGNFALAASYNDAKDMGRRGFSLGGTFTTGAFSFTADFTRDTKHSNNRKKYTNGLLEAKYALSKRTFVYGAFLRSDDTNNYGIGVRHNF
ncbi:MAG: porin [Pseudomonadota bacterium]|nr:porin [Pseudomonadota bacterium]